MKKVLLVDDDLSHSAVLTLASGVTGWKVIPKVDARSAITALAEDDRIDVMILSYEIGGLDPLSFITMARALKPKVPVIVLSRHGNKDIRQKMMSLGAFEYMSEPVTVIELGRVVRSALLNAEQDERRGDGDPIKNQPQLKGMK